MKNKVIRSINAYYVRLSFCQKPNTIVSHIFYVLTYPLTNALYLQLGRSKIGLMYQEVCYTNITSGIIKDMKIESKKQVKKS